VSCFLFHLCVGSTNQEMTATTDSFGSRDRPKKKSVEKVDYGGRDLSYWINV
jgi:hypothetical protein